MSKIIKAGTALITGSTGELGASMARILAKKGYDLILHYYSSKEEVERLAQNLSGEFEVKCRPLRYDLTLSNEVTKLVNQLQEEFLNWNLVINSASLFKRGSFLESSLEDFMANWQINLAAPMVLSRGLALHCKQHNLNGQVINMVDKNIVRHDTKYFPYLLGKKLLAEFTKMAALELAPRIRVNAIAPGFMTGSSLSDIASWEEKIINRIPLGRKGNKDDIDLALEYLLNNSFVTGQIIFVDGGASLNHAG